MVSRLFFMKIPLIIRNLPPAGCHIFVKGTIDGKRTLWLIDTGASQSVIDKTFVSSHFNTNRISESPHQTTGLGATYDKSEFVRLKNIAIGKFLIKSKKFAVIDLDVVNTAYVAGGMPRIEAIIGGDILKKYRGVINYNKREFSLMKP